MSNHDNYKLEVIVLGVFFSKINHVTIKNTSI